MNIDLYSYKYITKDLYVSYYSSLLFYQINTINKALV